MIFSRDEKDPNLDRKKFTRESRKRNFFEWLLLKDPAIGFVFHIGARTDTTEFDYSVHQQLNVEYSKRYGIIVQSKNSIWYMLLPPQLMERRIGIQ